MSGRSGRRSVLSAALTVAAAAGVATAHGLFRVAAAAGVPALVAWLYPVITDGLALVAYAATTRLAARGRRYAAEIIILAAGLSGLAQAVYLAGGIDARAAAPIGVRFGVGAWPAIAAALTAHLLHLISASGQPTAESEQQRPTSDTAASNMASNPSNVDVSNPASNPGVQPRPSPTPVQPGPEPRPSNVANAVNGTPRANKRGLAAERARAATKAHRARHGALPTVTELARQADVARGTAATALKALRDQHPALHLIANHLRTRPSNDRPPAHRHPDQPARAQPLTTTPRSLTDQPPQDQKP